MICEVTLRDRLVVAAATLPATSTGRFAVGVVAFLLIAASFSAMTTGALAFIGDVAPPDRESELMGLRTTAKGVGVVLGPVLVGVMLVESHGARTRMPLFDG